MNVKHKGIVHMSYTFLHSILHLPDDIKITGVKESPDFVEDYFLIRLEGGDLPEVREGARIPVIAPSIKWQENTIHWDFKGIEGVLI